MRPRRCLPRILAVAFLSAGSSLHAQERPAETRASPGIPMSRAILRAHAAGTRDSSGRPGRSYWQLRTRYSIDARLDVVTSRVSAKATIVLHNTSPVALGVVHLRLDQNRFRRGTGSDAASPHATGGMTVATLVVDGDTAAIGQAVLEALREYAAAWWFRHPSPWDFMIMMNRTLDRDLDAFWHRWIFSPG